ncbi:MAG: SpoIIE family protein phosphatase [Candidatus Riflebacteria bacterium]|nr:SpoIIE family protein phosphatase [Candidatus Riflebacteria bacterium]
MKRRIFWVASLLIFFALPLLLAIYGYGTRLDEIDELSNEKTFALQERILLGLRKNEDTHNCIDLLIRELFSLLRTDKGRLIKGVGEVKRRFPGIISVYAVNKDGELIKEASEPDSPKYILKTLYQNCMKTLGGNNSLEKVWPQVRAFIGREAVPEAFRDKRNVICEVNPGKSKHWFSFNIGSNGAVFAHIDECEGWSDLGMKDRIRSYLRKKGNHFFQVGITAPGDSFPSAPVSFAILQHQKNSRSSFLFQNSTIYVNRLKSSSFLWIAFQKGVFYETSFHRLLSAVFGTLLFAFLAYISAKIHFGNQYFFFSIRWRLISLFFYASLLPLLIIFSVGWDYMKKEYNAKMAECFEKAEQSLRTIDLHFPLLRMTIQNNLNRGLGDVKYSSPDEISRTHRTLSFLCKRYKANSLVLYNRKGQSEFWSRGVAHSNPMDKGGKAFGELIQAAIPYLNNEEADLKTTLKADFFQAFGGFNLVAILANGIGKMEEFQFTRKRAWLYFKAFYNDMKKVTHILGFTWDRDDLEKEYIARQTSRRKYIPPGINVIALGTVKEWNVTPSERLLPVARSLATWIELWQGTINRKVFRKKNTIFFTGIKPKELKSCILIAVQNDFEILQRIGRMRRSLYVFAVICIIISVFLGLVLSQKILNPIENLSQGVISVQNKQFQFRVPVLETDELGNLTEMFNQMVENLYEVDMAQEVQSQLFPAQSLQLGEYLVFGKTLSASQLGGDYFDYLSISNRYIFVLIGDVTGHGVPAALVMAMAKGIVEEKASAGADLSEVITILNATMYKTLKRKRLMTANFFCIDTISHECRFFNCGHPFPFLMSSNGDINMIEGSGVALGVREKIRLTPVSFTLNKGERIIMYTDGLVESIPATKEASSYEQFRKYLSSRPCLPAEPACNDYLNHHRQTLSGEPLPDDFTFVLIEHV